MKAIEQIRTPGFVDGVPIRLADGQEWIFPKPRLVVSPIRDRETGRFTASMTPVFNDEYGDVLQKHFDATVKRSENENDGEAAYTVMSARLDLASILLCSNYVLSDAHVSRLLTIDDATSVTSDSWLQIQLLVLGESPKQSPDTSE